MSDLAPDARAKHVGFVLTASHPGQAFRIFFVEDDDERCVLKFDGPDVTGILDDLGDLYSDRTSARDTALNFVKALEDAATGRKFLNGLIDFFQTKDEFLGNAIEDDITGEFWPGANWTIKGENSATNGYLALEMR